MLGARAASVWTSAARAWTAESAGSTCRTTIKDRFTALDTWTLRCRRSSGRRDRRHHRCLVDRAGTSLWHHDATDGLRRRWRRDRLSRTMSSWVCRMCWCRGYRRCRGRCGGHRSGRRRLLFNRSWSRSGSRRLSNWCGGRSRCGFNRRGWRWQRSNCLRLHRGWRGLDRIRLCFSGRRNDRRFDHHRAWGWDNGYGRACRCSRCRSLGDNWACRRPARDGARRLRRDDRGRRPRLRNNLPRFRTGGSSGRRSGYSRRSRLYGRLGRGHRRRSRGHVHLAGLSFFLLLPGQYGLHHVARLGNVREIDFGRNAL
jgi:hypothetical protein